MSAKPMKRKSLARQTARESPKSSCPCTRSLSMRLMTIMPSNEQIPGSQSRKVTCTGGGICTSPSGECACAERMAASRNVQFASANYDPTMFVQVDCTTKSSFNSNRARRIGETYQTACKVYPNRPPVLSECDSREGVDANSTGVVVRAREGHGGRCWKERRDETWGCGRGGGGTGGTLGAPCAAGLAAPRSSVAASSRLSSSQLAPSPSTAVQHGSTALLDVV